jgi:transcriptional regulator with XRE-family HTH domain
MNFFGSNIKLLRTRKIRTQSDIAAALETKRTTVNALENSISQPTVYQLQAFSKYFGIAIDTLINTDLSQLSESQFTDLHNGFDVFIRGSNLRVIATTVDRNNIDNIEFVNEKAKAGYVTHYADPEYIGNLPVFQLPFLSKEKKYRAFTISGDSMLPIPNGSVVIGEFVQDFYDIRNNEACVLVTLDEGIVFKIVENKIALSFNLRLISLNPEFSPFEVPVSEIKEVWKFVCYLNTEIPEPETDIHKVLKTVNELKLELQNRMKQEEIT